MKKRLIFLLRHCQTELSGNKRLIGQHDVGLSTAGIELCDKLAAVLSKRQFSHLFCSDLKRTKDMATKISMVVNTKPQPLKELNEINLGIWDGLNVEDIKKKYPQEYMDRGKDLTNYRIPGGENYPDLYKRVLLVFKSINNQEGNLLVISHAAVNRAILSYVLGISLDDALNLPQDYGCCNIIEQVGTIYKASLINGGIDQLKEWQLD